MTGLGLVAVGTYSWVELARFGRAEQRRTTFVFAAGQHLAPGVHTRLVDLTGTLARLGYTEARTPPAAPGQFRRTASGWDIVLRGQETDSALRGTRIRVEVENDRIARVTRNGQHVGPVTLEAEVLTGGDDRVGEDYRPLGLADTPPLLVDAVLAAEDHRFFEHGALDPRGLARAAWANLREGRTVQGGSTITQQLVKIRLLTPKRTLPRKLQEAWLAILVEARYSKNQILESYLNEIYLGQRGALAIRGVSAAARAYFGKEVHQLTAAEAALLAGMIRAPNTHSPSLNPERARRRRDAVLARMRDLGRLAPGAYDHARGEPLRVLARPAPGQPAPYFADYVRLELEQRFGDEARLGQQNLRVYTTLDLALQRFAENALARGLDRLETGLPRLRRRDPQARIQAALIALDPATGEIRALVGGREYQASQFNRAIMARRQPGSAFKPFVYAAALAPRNGRPLYTAASMVDDSPVTVTVGGKRWTPRNYENRYEGPVTVRRALERSLNAATVRIAQAVGPAAIVETARTFGFGDNLAAVPSVALGAFEATPFELARAYLPLANAGFRPGPPGTVRAVYQGDGTVVPSVSAPPAQVVTPAEAYLLTALLQGAVRSGTGAVGAVLGIPGDIAGKTGTTNEGRDAWFVGYSSRLLTVVWVGFDDGQPHQLTGAQAALPIWADFMRQALAAYPAPSFVAPEGVTSIDIDSTNGQRANEYCPLVIREVFLKGTEPEACREHARPAPRIVDWWREFRSWFQR
ncbi:MAG: PBP1A family penicillin-binding protein [Candidatus Rokuibacteriota bacterium]